MSKHGLAPVIPPARVRVLKVPHHGSATSSSMPFLAALRPQIAIVSCGRGNRFGHPSPAVLARYRQIGAAVYRTDLQGAITIDTDGRTVKVTPFVRPGHEWTSRSHFTRGRHGRIARLKHGHQNRKTENGQPELDTMEAE